MTHYLLHIVDGVVNELEVFTDTLDEPHRHPDVDQLTVEVDNGPPPFLPGIMNA